MFASILIDKFSRLCMHPFDRQSFVLASLRKCICYTVEPQYSAPDWEMSKGMFYQSVNYIEVQYNIT